MRVLPRKHDFVIILGGAGGRPGKACQPEKGVFCFWPFSQGSDSLCGGINVLITIVVGAQRRPPVVNDGVRHFFRTTASLVALPSTKERQVKGAGSIYFYSICSPSAKIKQTKMWIQPLGVVTELILWVLDYEGKPTDGMGLNECLDIGAPTRKSGLDTAAHRAEGTSNCWLEWLPRNRSQEGPSEMAVAFQVVLVSYCCCNQ